MTRTFCLTLLLTLLATAPATGLAQTPAGAVDGYDKPRRGMSMTSVERAFGAPETKRAAVGEPPITRWVYGNFTVYFEYDRVIHAVVTQ
ncbi:MAG: hypothetical protein AAFZ58_13595 [Pseudomonadota bacterium]